MNRTVPVCPSPWRKDFPIFSKNALRYFDTASSAQKPQAVLDALLQFYGREYSNVHRGLYRFSEQATLRCAEIRSQVAQFIGAHSEREIVFTHGATESINLVAYSWGQNHIRAGDEIVVSLLEHHANFVPWQLLAKRTGAIIRFAPVAKSGELLVDELLKLITSRTKLIAVTQLSNALGLAVPLEPIIAAAHSVGAKVLVDGAQGVIHLPTRISEMKPDFYVFSGHKLYGPTGIGVLYVEESLLESMPPFLSGGDMILSVRTEGTEFAEIPRRFEAGTPHIAGIIGLGAALTYLEQAGRERIFEHEAKLLRLLERELSEIPEVALLGDSERHALVSFTVENIHPHDIAQMLSGDDIAVRAGHHCAQPLMEALGVPASTRASVGMYNDSSDIEVFVESLKRAIGFFR